MKHFYAESKGQLITENIYEGGFLRYEKNSKPYCDLWRFNSKKARDNFVTKSDNRNKIKLIDAKIKHTDQFSYWREQG